MNGVDLRGKKTNTHKEQNKQKAPNPQKTPNTPQNTQSKAREVYAYINTTRLLQILGYLAHSRYEELLNDLFGVLIASVPGDEGAFRSVQSTYIHGLQLCLLAFTGGTENRSSRRLQSGQQFVLWGRRQARSRACSWSWRQLRAELRAGA